MHESTHHRRHLPNLCPRRKKNTLITAIRISLLYSRGDFLLCSVSGPHHGLFFPLSSPKFLGSWESPLLPLVQFSLHPPSSPRPPLYSRVSDIIPRQSPCRLPQALHLQLPFVSVHQQDGEDLKDESTLHCWQSSTSAGHCSRQFLVQGMTK